MFPSAHAIAFGLEESPQATIIYRSVRPQGDREIDIAIAACAIVGGAALWTLNVRDFADIPGIRLNSARTNTAALDRGVAAAHVPWDKMRGLS